MTESVLSGIVADHLRSIGFSAVSGEDSLSVRREVSGTDFSIEFPPAGGIVFVREIWSGDAPSSEAFLARVNVVNATTPNWPTLVPVSVRKKSGAYRVRLRSHLARYERAAFGAAVSEFVWELEAWLDWRAEETFRFGSADN